MKIYCDNDALLRHGRSPLSGLSDKQSHSDMLRLFKMLVQEQPFQCDFLWVRGHAVEIKGWEKCNRAERMNHLADGLAKVSLQLSVATGRSITRRLPLAHFYVVTDDGTVTGSIRSAVTEHWGRREARSFLDSAYVITADNFDRVWWDAIGDGLGECPTMYRVWHTKHVADCAGTNLQLSYWDDSHDPLCPDCRSAPETCMHITRCRAES